MLANGSISNINYQSHPDLFWALRGGGPNFGIVTRFDLETFCQGPVWAGNPVYMFSDILERRARSASFALHQPKYFSKLYVTQTLGRLANLLACVVGRCTTTDEFLEVLVNMARKGEKEEDVPYMHLYMTFAYLPQFDFLAGGSCMVHSEPVANPPAFEEFNVLTPTTDGRKVRNLTDLIPEIDYWNPPGRRLVKDSPAQRVRPADSKS